MKTAARLILMSCVLSGALCGCASSGDSSSKAKSTANETTALGANCQAAYRQLLAQEPAAAALAKNAKGVLVFHKVLKAGFIFGGFHGEGSLLSDGQPTGRYGTTGATAGLQAGVQTYSYALFFMTDADLAYLKSSAGWEIGTGPSVTIVDKGLAGSLTTTTAREGVYCFFFDQKGLMAGLGLQGSKITRVDR